MANFAVRLVHGQGWDPSRPIRDQDGWDEHAAFMDGLVDDGFVILGGPVGNGEQTLHVVEAADENDVRTRFARDPWASAGLLQVGTIEPWALWLDGRPMLAGGPRRTRGTRSAVGGPCQDERMRINQQIVVFDAADLTAESAFWAAVLGGTVDAEDDWHMIYADGQPRMGVQLAPDHVPPEWPDGTPQQIHLDLYVDDIKTAHDEVTSLGAKLLKPADDIESAHGFQVYADPAGHPFCLCWVPRAT